MSQTKDINGIPVLGSVLYENKTYYLDIEENIYEYDYANNSFILVKDETLINNILDFLEAKPLDII